MFMFTHAPLQNVWLGGQVHAPATQLSPAGHTVAQVLQWLGSVLRLTQVPLQLFRPTWQDRPHRPPEHTLPTGQRLAAASAVGSVVRLGVAADPAARGVRRLAREHAGAGRADVAGQAGRGAGAAVGVVGLEC